MPLLINERPHYYLTLESAEEDARTLTDSISPDDPEPWKFKAIREKNTPWFKIMVLDYMGYLIGYI